MLDLIDLFFSATESVVEDSEVEVESNEFEGVENGVFVGNEEELEEITEAGMIEDSEHIDTEDIVRDIGARDEYLKLIGFDSVPDGYEVHHIIPLSEGGTDDPSNMVLLSESDHSQITKEHRDFYGWNK